MKESVGKFAFIVVVVVLAGMYLALSILGGIFGGDEENPMTAADRLLWGFGLGFAAIFLVAGLSAIKRSPRLAGGLMVASALAATSMTWWSIFVPIVAILVAAWGIRRARSLAMQREGAVGL